MAPIDIPEAKQEFQERGWDITDFISDPPSVTARTSDGIGVIIDDPIDGMNNIIVKSPKFEVTALSDYHRAQDIADEPITITVTGPDYTRLRHSDEFEGTQEELIKKLAESDETTVALQFARYESTGDVSLAEIYEFVDQIQSLMESY